MSKRVSKKNRLWAVLSYLGILIIFPLIYKQDDSFVLYHAKQGVILIFLEIVLNIFVVKFVAIPISLCYTIIGVYNCLRGKKHTLPFIGVLADKIKL